VSHFFFRDFLARFDQQGRLQCPCGQEHRLQTSRTFVDQGALDESIRHLNDSFGRTARLWVLSDENTEAAAAARWKEAAGASRIVSRVLPGRPIPVPTMELVESLAADARREAPSLIVAVGSGVISDLGKSVSLAVDVPNWCIATAPSVDAFSSATSALRVDGFHSAVPSRIAQVIVCDPEIISGAPHELFLAGLGDLLAKYLAHLDWNVARMVSGEWYCPLVAAAALDSARSALAAGRLLRDDPREARRTLTDAALCSGFAMQATGGSRPAASAEHMLAHFWETTNQARNEKLNLHGILAAAASRLLLPVYEALYERLSSFEPDDQERLRAYDAELPWQETLEEGLRPFLRKVSAEAGSRQFDRGILARRLYAFRDNRTEIIALAGSVLGEMRRAVESLEGMGYPFDFGVIGLTAEEILLPLRNVRLLRHRYSSYDLAYELGLDSFICREGERGVVGKSSRGPAGPAGLD
jgi:glycerol-1-phosphate dehydrogenase [NAD(P)+]